MRDSFVRASIGAPALPDDLLSEHFSDAEPEADPETAVAAPRSRSLRGGCYLIHFKPHGSPLVAYDGTLRVQKHSAGSTASGDLYQRRIVFVPPTRPAAGGGAARTPHAVLGPAPHPAHGIPIQPRAQYRYYVRVTSILERTTTARSFKLGLELHRFDAASETWADEGPCTAKMTWTSAPAGYPSPRDYLIGELENTAGTAIGQLTMGWLCKHLRKATLEIDTVSVSEAPLDNGDGKNWATVFDEIGWQVKIVNSNHDVVEPSGESWSDAEMHAAMLARRDSADLDHDWRYHILAVRQIDSTPRGIMYDNSATDSNNVPREGVGISSHWIIPSDPEWGLVQGVRFGAAKKPFFRTAVHELGHAFGLYHNTADLGFMNTTDVIAASATPGTPFPNNIQWAYAADDLKRLRHMPDIYVRPGGLPFGTDYAATPISPDDLAAPAEQIELSVKPVLDVLPIGAPARVDVQLINRSQELVLAPNSVSLGSGFVRGSVIGPDGVARAFSPLVLCMDCEPLQPLEPEQRITGSLTLLRGADGALLPAAGLYTIDVSVSWEIDGIKRTARGKTNLYVTQAQDSAHAEAALRVLSAPDLLLTVVFGGDHLDAGNAALQTALANPVLRPHFAYTEAKRRVQRFRTRKPDPKGALEVIDTRTVMSKTEAAKLQRKLREQSAGNGDDLGASLMSRMEHAEKAAE